MGHTSYSYSRTSLNHTRKILQTTFRTYTKNCIRPSNPMPSNYYIVITGHFNCRHGRTSEDTPFRYTRQRMQALSQDFQPLNLNAKYLYSIPTFTAQSKKGAPSIE